MNNTKIKNMTLAAILTAFTIIIPFVFAFPPFKLEIDPYTATLAVHAPTIIAMFINPVVAFFVALCSAVGFIITAPLIVAIRALSHVIFALVGAKMIQHGKNIYFTAVVTGIVHALSESAVVYVGHWFGLVPDAKFAIAMYVIITFTGTFIHHCVDFAIAIFVINVLKKAKLMQ